MVPTKQSIQQQKGHYVLIRYSNTDKDTVIHEALGIYNNEEAAYAAAIVSQMQLIESAVSARKRSLITHLSAKQTVVNNLCRSIKEDFATYKDRFQYLTEQSQLIFDGSDIQHNVSSSICRERFIVLPILSTASAAVDNMNESVFRIKLRNFQDALRVKEDVEEDLENSDGEDDEEDDEEDAEGQDSEDDDEEEAEEGTDGSGEADNKNDEEDDSEVPEDSETEEQLQNDNDASDAEGEEAADNELEDDESDEGADEELLDTEDTVASDTAVANNTRINEREQRLSSKRKSKHEDDDEEDEEVDEIDEDNEEEEFELLEDEEEQQQSIKKRRTSTDSEL